MNAPLDPSISELLRGSSLAPMMDQPVSHILHSMGLPQLPAIPPMPPLPGLPPMPVIDLAAIVRPLTDLASSFGTGTFAGAEHPAVGVEPAPAPAPAAPAPPPAVPSNSPAAQQNSPAKPQAPAPPAAPAGTNPAGAPIAAPPNVDPTQVLSAITSGLQTTMQLGMSALQLAMQLWQGQGADQASSTAAKTQDSSGQLANQSVGQKAILGEGATSVFTGGALMTAVVSKYMTSVALTAPALSVPGGSVFLAAETADAIAEGLAVIAKTRVEMVIHSANMLQAGQKVEVSSVPKGVSAASQASTAADTASGTSSSSSSELQELMQLISPVSQMLSTGAQSATQLSSVAKSLAPGSATPADASLSSSAALGAYKGSDSKGSAAGGGGAAGGSIAAVPATPMTPYVGTQLAGGTPGTGGAAAPEALAAEPAATSSPMSSPGMMPAGGAGAAAAAAKGAGANPAGGEAHSNLVTGSNGDDVVGDLTGATLPVVGALNRAVEAPPDKELTL